MVHEACKTLVRVGTRYNHCKLL